MHILLQVDIFKPSDIAAVKKLELLHLENGFCFMGLGLLPTVLKNLLVQKQRNTSVLRIRSTVSRAASHFHNISCVIDNLLYLGLPLLD